MVGKDKELKLGNINIRAVKLPPRAKNNSVQSKLDLRAIFDQVQRKK